MGDAPSPRSRRRQRRSSASTIVGHASDRGRIAGLSRAVDDGDEVALGDGAAAPRARIVHNPGHTLGAITYVIDGCAFTGDTLFAAGCGRVFEGTMPR